MRLNQELPNSANFYHLLILLVGWKLLPHHSDCLCFMVALDCKRGWGPETESNMSTDPTCLFDVSVYIVDLFERFRYANICSICLKAF